MSETSDSHSDCVNFQSWLLEAGSTDDPGEWTAHLSACGSCHCQWRAHRALAFAFADAPEPRLSPTFKVQLPKADGPVRAPLSGWRRAALLGYGVVSALIVVWTMRDVSLPAIDVSSPWTAVAALAAVPATFGLAIAVSRWLPMRRVSTQPRMLAF